MGIDGQLSEQQRMSQFENPRIREAAEDDSPVEVPIQWAKVSYDPWVYSNTN